VEVDMIKLPCGCTVRVRISKGVFVANMDSCSKHPKTVVFRADDVEAKASALTDEAR